MIETWRIVVLCVGVCFFVIVAIGPVTDFGRRLQRKRDAERWLESRRRAREKGQR